MKSAVETLNPTRVRLTVEVPFGELKSSVDAAYKKIASQIRLQGFRPGKVPPRLIDQRVGRGAVLEEAVQEALPRLYGDAVRDNAVRPLGHPEVNVSELDDGDHLTFTAEVDIRPVLELPAYRGLAVTVDDVEVDEERVEEQLGGLRDRFATLTAADRAVRAGDYVSIDLAATVQGEPVSGAQSAGMSYEVGSDRLMPGLDDALPDMVEGQTSTFGTELVAGEHVGRTAQVSVTVRSVKVKELPKLDDDFAQTASEFDTLEELRADLRGRLERVRRIEQGLQARDRALEMVVSATEVPMPESVVEAEVSWRLASFYRQLEQAGVSRADYLQQEDRSQEQFDTELREGAAEAVKAQLVLDAVADAEALEVSQAELTEQVVRRAEREERPAEEVVRDLVQGGQLPSMGAEVRRGKALALILEAAKITDASGRPVDLEQLRAGAAPPAVA